MTVLVLDPGVARRLKAERERTGADRYDEVWDGVYVMTPLPNDEHQALVAMLVSILQEVIGWPGLGQVRPGVNVSDREKGWEKNYRGPDVVVFLEGTRAKNFGTHWCGGPDFVIEIISPKDRSRDKLAFYAKIGTRELLLVDRKPWALELYRWRDGQLELVGKSTPRGKTVLASQVVPLTFRLRANGDRPRIEVVAPKARRRWLV